MLIQSYVYLQLSNECVLKNPYPTCQWQNSNRRKSTRYIIYIERGDQFLFKKNFTNTHLYIPKIIKHCSFLLTESNQTIILWITFHMRARAHTTDVKNNVMEYSTHFVIAWMGKWTHYYKNSKTLENRQGFIIALFWIKQKWVKHFIFLLSQPTYKNVYYYFYQFRHVLISLSYLRYWLNFRLNT